MIHFWDLQMKLTRQSHDWDEGEDSASEDRSDQSQIADAGPRLDWHYSLVLCRPVRLQVEGIALCV